MTFYYDLTRLRSREDLINRLHVSEKMFEQVLAFVPYVTAPEPELIDGAYRPSIPLFFRHEIPKKNRKRGVRLVWEPGYLMHHYKALGNWLGSFFAHEIPRFPHPRTFGYVGGRNIRENAWDHCGHKNLISIDLKDFFPSITAGRIADLLMSLHVDPTVADLLSRFVTIAGTLPLGLPTSPTIANAICMSLDIDMVALAQNHQATFSRYADDCSFSSDGSLPSLEEMTLCVESHGFKIAESKTRRSRLGQAHYVTGLSVSDPERPHLPKHKKRRLRQELYYAEKFGLLDHLAALDINDDQMIRHEINRLEGTVMFTSYLEPRLRAGLRGTWDKILLAAGESPSFEPRNMGNAPFHIHVDEAEYTRPDGLKILAMAMVVSQHQNQVDAGTQAVLSAELSNPFAAGKREVLEKEGLHYTQVSKDLQKAYIDKLQTLPFEGYVAMTSLVPGRYEQTYLDLLGYMIGRRLMAAESQAANFVFEKNDKVRQIAVKEVIEKAFCKLLLINNRRPQTYTLEFVGKLNLGVCVPDALLGALGSYLKVLPPIKAGETSREELLFESIRHKYKIIFNRDVFREYSRRNPIKPWAVTG